MRPDSELKAFSVMPDFVDEQAAEAAAQGRPSEGILRIFGDVGEPYEDIRYIVYGDGSVTVLTEGWQPVIEDGKVYTFARTADG